MHGHTGTNPFTWYTLANSIDPKAFNTEITKRTSFTGFSPRNNKCFVYPYNYILASNFNGSSNIYKYEDFSTAKCVFQNLYCITIGGSGITVPLNYKGMLADYDEALPLGKYPTCGWSSDAFINWLTENATNVAVNAVIGVGALVAMGVATGGAGAAAAGAAGAANGGLSGAALLGGVATSSASTVANAIGQFNDAKLQPNVRGGTSTGDVIFASSSNAFVFREMRCKNEYMKIIDDYFTRFGYAVKALASPNLTGRSNWNYIEIGQSEEIGYGDVPSKFMDIINKACRKGVTIWHSHDNLGNYSLTNSIVT